MIHITLGTMPTLLRGIVRSALQSQQDFAVNDASPVVLGATERCDVLLLCAQQGGAARQSFQNLLEPDPAAVVMLEPDGDHAAILRIGRDECALEAPDDLFRVIRSAVRRSTGPVH